jgi:hypothetical protein
MTLEELQKLCDEATPGPWVAKDYRVYGPDIDRQHDRLITCDGGYASSGGANQYLDAAFIAAARTYLPKLIELAKAAEGFMSLIKITKAALQERRELDRQLSDPNYWDRLVDKYCSKPADDDDGSSRKIEAEWRLERALAALEVPT